MMHLRPGAIIPAVYSEHVADAGFTWGRREKVAVSPQRRFVDLAEMDETLAAHVQGLRLGGEAGLALTEPEPDDPEELWTRLVVASASSTPDAAVHVIERHAVSAESVCWVRAALVWLPLEQRSALARALSASKGNAVAQAVCLEEAAAAGQWSGAAVGEALRSEHAPVRASAQHALARLGLREHVAIASQGLMDEAPDVRYAAARTNVLLGQREGLEVLRALAEDDAPHPRARAAAELWGRRAPLQDVLRWAAEQRPRSLLGALRGAAALAGAGTVECGDLLLEFLAHPLECRMAAEALALFGGIDLANDVVIRDADSDEVDDDEGDDDEGAIGREHPTWFELPVPEPGALAEQWRRLRGSWPEKTPLLAGQAISDAALQQTLRAGTQAQRAAAALEIALRSREPAPLFDVAAPARTQHRRLEALSKDER